MFSGVAIGSGWQAHVAYVNLGSYYLVGVPLGIFFGWSLDFGLTVCKTVNHDILESISLYNINCGKTTTI